MIEPLSAGTRHHQDRYTIVRVIAAGGMGVVYLAFDEVEEKNVAVKQTFFTDPELRKAFEREARLLERLNHPSIPKVTDRFEVRWQAFLVMSFITGKDVSQLLTEKIGLDGKPFSVEKVLKWADSLLRTLEFLHTQTPPIIHRDIKPANLKETRDGRLMLLDFGLAKGHATQNSQPPSLAANSPGFSSPEQTQNEGTDARSDIYSVAATMYQLLSGVIPPAAFSRGLLALSHLPDSLKPLLEIAPDVPEQVAGVVMAGLSMIPAQRPQSAREMRRLLGLTSNDPYIGKVIKGCRIEKKLGTGGMGAVYLGIHENLMVERAVKVILPDPPPDATTVERFRLEARTTARIDHPNVVRVFDFEQIEDDAFVMVMELLQGEELADLLKREGPLSPKRAVEIAVGIGEGLQAAHDKGIIHRDLKPANVMVLADGKIKVVDFGIAKLLRTEKGLTGEGLIVGTPLYMSPEQLRGLSIDARSDQYPLGLLVSVMMTGRFPFQGETAQELVMARLTQSPIPMSEAKPDVPGRLNEAVLRALSLDPNKRFETVLEFVTELKEGISEGLTGNKDLGAVIPVADPSAPPKPNLPERVLQFVTELEETVSEIPTGNEVGRAAVPVVDQSAPTKPNLPEAENGVLVPLPPATIPPAHDSQFQASESDRFQANHEKPPLMENALQPTRGPRAGGFDPSKIPDYPLVRLWTPIPSIRTRQKVGKLIWGFVSVITILAVWGSLLFLAKPKIIIATNVPGAQVFLDGEAVGTTSISNSQLTIPRVPTGRRAVRIIHPDYFPSERQIEVKFSFTPATFTFKMNPAASPLSIRTTPTLSKVLIDGEVAGETDSISGAFDLPKVKQGPHVLLVQHPGFEDYTTQFVMPDGPHSLNVQMNPTVAGFWSGSWRRTDRETNVETIYNFVLELKQVGTNVTGRWEELPVLIGNAKAPPKKPKSFSVTGSIIGNQLVIEKKNDNGNLIKFEARVADSVREFTGNFSTEKSTGTWFAARMDTKPVLNPPLRIR